MASLPTMNAQDVAKAGAPKLLAENIWVALKVSGLSVECDDGEGGTGNYRMVFRFSPLKDPTDAASATTPLVYDRVTLPFTNNEWTNDDGSQHKAPDTWAIIRQRMVAIFGEYDAESNPDGLVMLPKRGAAGYHFKAPAGVWGDEPVDGLIDDDKYNEAKQAALTAAFQKTLDLYTAVASGDNPVKDFVFFGKVRHSDGKGGRTYQNFVAMEPAQPDNAVIVTDPEEFRHKVA